MADAEKILNPEEYKNYRNIRSVAVLLIIIGFLFLLGSLGMLYAVSKAADGGHPEAIEQGYVINFILATTCGFASVIAGIAILLGNRKLAPLAYVMAAFYLFAFPIGTLLSIFLFKGLSSYLDSVDLIKKTQAQ